MDSSTRAECRVLEDSVGGPEALARITGSSGTERFTASQVSLKALIQTDSQNCASSPSGIC